VEFCYLTFKCRCLHSWSSTFRAILILKLCTKTGGAGGKGTWGKPGSELVEGVVGDDDPQDPNYDSDSLDDPNVKFEAITPPLNDDEVERHVSPIISEYFEHGSTDEVMASLDELNLAKNEYQVRISKRL